MRSYWLLDLHILGKARFVDALARKIALFLADGQTDDFCAKGPGGELGKAAPAAADLEQRLARLQVDRFCKPAIFVGLRSGQIGGAVLEQGGGIGHARIEPGRIEGVADVVVGVNIAPRLPLGVPVEPVTDGLDGAHHRLAGECGLHPFLVDAEQIEELRQVRRVPFTAQIGFRNADVAAAQEPRGKTVVVDFHGGGRARPAAAQADHAAVGQRDVERAVLQP